MNKIWKLLGIGLVLLAFIGAVSAQWQQTGASQIDNNEANKAEELLANASIEEFQSYRDDETHYRVVSDGEYVGVLWEDLNLKDLTVGEPYNARWGVKVPLVHNNEAVGQLFVEGKPEGHGWQNNDNGRYNCGGSNGQANGQAQAQGSQHGQGGGTPPHNGHSHEHGFRYR